MSSKYAFTSSLREVRVHLCHSSPASEATRYVPLSPYGMLLNFRKASGSNANPFAIDRSFLKRAYPTMKKNNPNIPILIREATGIEPKGWARYGMKGIRQIVQKLIAGRLWQGVIKNFVRCANSATAMKD